VTTRRRRAAKALESLNISLEAVRQQVEEIIGRDKRSDRHIPSARAKKVSSSAPEACSSDTTKSHRAHPARLIRGGRAASAAKLGADFNRVRQTVTSSSGLHRRQG